MARNLRRHNASSTLQLQEGLASIECLGYPGLATLDMDHDASVKEQEFKESLDELRKIVANLDDTRWLNEDMPVTPDRLEASAGL